MTYEEFFKKVKEAFADADVSGMTEHLAYQFNITGEAEGIFYVEVKEGKLYVEPYDYHDRDAMFTCSAENLMKIANGKLDPILAVTLKKLKVEGNIDKALKLKSLKLLFVPNTGISVYKFNIIFFHLSNPGQGIDFNALGFQFFPSGLKRFLN